jgi:putative SOS response-associated peptidase YedK
MCNLYAMTRPLAAVRAFARAARDVSGFQRPLPAIFPDQLAPVVRLAEDGQRTLGAMRWGFPPPGSLGSRPVTNVRNTKSPYWRPWLVRGYRCLVPATAFCEFTDTRPKVPHWFALAPELPLFAFAGIWRPWSGTRKDITGEHMLFAFFTTEPNELIRPVHAQAMPVILTGQDCDTWLEAADVRAALALQRPAPAGQLQLVATGQRGDAAALRHSPPRS